MRDLDHVEDVEEQDVLVLNTTMACPLSCDFCCYGCNPNRKERMPLDRALDLIDQAARIPSISSVGFTGGEPLMFRDDFDAMIARLKVHGLPFTVATAGHWAADPEAATQTADAMVDAGLRRINFSYDDAHAVFIPREAIINGAKAVARHGVPVYLVGTFAHPDRKLETFLPELCDVPNVRMFSKVIAKVGRGKKAEVDYGPEHLRKVATCYRRIHHDIVVFWDGKTYPCCSTFNRATQGICVGNAFEEPLRDIRDRIEASFLIRTLKRKGFEEFHGILEKHAPELNAAIPQFRDYPGACSACNAIFAKRDMAKRVNDFFNDFETKSILESLDHLERILGDRKAAAVFQELSHLCSTQEETHHAHGT
ncbi:Iron-sulfur cluster-binding domain-containing protein [Palleronia salina]|uniref:Iron-sulfur cluster-binding domain-containing protein n=1 Tax=Palleronia salina TaxID=313368 RepID=A0A1M6G1F7_9RHOB|nr:radical SAM protein [Palleronia salina]SHJ03780.1 Iron-sulfur cluster-binding domain-containing protein [Palleronia salina]